MCSYTFKYISLKLFPESNISFFFNSMNAIYFVCYSLNIIIDILENSYKYSSS